MSQLSPITEKDLKKVEAECFERLRERQLYQVRNEAKLRAVHTSESYEHFKDIVDAAHLVPISRKDKNDSKTRSRNWNTAAKET